MLLYSQTHPGLLLHGYLRVSDVYRQAETRVDHSPVNEFLQVATLQLAKDKTFRPHRHIEQLRTTNVCQEAWLVVAGRVRVIYYDLDDEILTEVDLGVGDLTMTFRGGHNYRALEDGTLVVEIKTGPYQGQVKDKVFIDKPADKTS